MLIALRELNKSLCQRVLHVFKHQIAARVSAAVPYYTVSVLEGESPVGAEIPTDGRDRLMARTCVLFRPMCGLSDVSLSL